ncbi:DUF2304 domain-containing protein [Arthrobacter sp. GCM10027362]|uniref:DUF2304 domain-containing protein n=1 Tax=Arthrobacter sp. GCM10027362 TaxID=3273379 RepID=UPI00362C81F6
MIIIVQLLLFLAVVIGTLALMRGAGNARHTAVRRILLMLFAVVAALSVFFPAMLTWFANRLGIGRGTDLVLYALIVFFMIYMATSFQRTRQLEARITKLARRIALDEAPNPAAVAEGRMPERGPLPGNGDGAPKMGGGAVSPNGTGPNPEARRRPERAGG